MSTTTTETTETTTTAETTTETAETGTKVAKYLDRLATEIDPSNPLAVIVGGMLATRRALLSAGSTMGEASRQAVNTVLLCKAAVDVLGARTPAKVAEAAESDYGMTKPWPATGSTATPSAWFTRSVLPALGCELRDGEASSIAKHVKTAKALLSAELPNSKAVTGMLSAVKREERKKQAEDLF